MSSITEEIKELHLYKIQVFEDKTSEFRQKYKSIRKNHLNRVYGNTSSNIMRLVLGLLCLTFIFLSLATLIPHEIILNLRKYSEKMNLFTYEELFNGIEVARYFFFLLSFVFYRMGRLIKKNLQKRELIYKLSKLNDELIVFMDTEAHREKKRFKYLA